MDESLDEWININIIGRNIKSIHYSIHEDDADDDDDDHDHSSLRSSIHLTISWSESFMVIVHTQILIYD